MVASVKDVAELASVSASTVSNYFHRPHLLSAASHDRIEAAIKTLGYVPNESARQLRNGASRTLALILLDAWQPFFANIARGVEDAVREAGWSLFFANSGRDEDRELTNIAMFDAHRVQGVIINPKGDVTESLLRLQKRGIQCVSMSPPIVSPEVPSVAFDDLRGGQLAGEHLLALGRKRIVFIGDSQSVSHSAKRFAGLQAAVRAARGSSADVPEIHVRALDMANGMLVGEQLLQLPNADRPDAIFAANDMLALGVMTVFERAGLRIPEAIAIIGYDDVEFAGQAVVPLTTIRQPAYDMGRRAAAMLLQRLDNPETPAEHVNFDVRLIRRASTLGNSKE